MKSIITFNYDISKYPPILQAIQSLLKIGHEVEVIGYFSDYNQKKLIESKGVKVVPIPPFYPQFSLVKKIFHFVKYRAKVNSVVKRNKNNDVIVWVFGNENAWILYRLFESYRCILYQFEFPQFKVGLKYRVVSPFIRYHRMIKKAFKVVSCEYNRACVTQAYFGIPTRPYVIPNKSDYDVTDEIEGAPSVLNSLKMVPKGQKIILYQGIFNQPERRLEELCQSIEFLPNEYCICIMGGDCEAKKKLQEKYEASRVIFLPFLPAPYHLAITKHAHIGFLSYFPAENNINSTLNTLYCAPNKIFEYSKFGIPMISNDVPALELAFQKFEAGLTVSEFTPIQIAKKIQDIDEKYNLYRQGAFQLYASVDVSKLYSDLL